MKILPFSGAWPPLNDVRGSVPGFGTRSHFRTLIALKSASVSPPATNGVAFTVATGWLVGRTVDQIRSGLAGLPASTARATI
jgi:hypothetical protein